MGHEMKIFLVTFICIYSSLSWSCNTEEDIAHSYIQSVRIENYESAEDYEIRILLAPKYSIRNMYLSGVRLQVVSNEGIIQSVSPLVLDSQFDPYRIINFMLFRDVMANSKLIFDFIPKGAVSLDKYGVTKVSGMACIKSEIHKLKELRKLITSKNRG